MRTTIIKPEERANYSDIVETNEYVVCWRKASSISPREWVCRCFALKSKAIEFAKKLRKICKNNSPKPYIVKDCKPISVWRKDIDVELCIKSADLSMPTIVYIKY